MELDQLKQTRAHALKRTTDSLSKTEYRANTYDVKQANVDLSLRFPCACGDHVRSPTFLVPPLTLLTSP
jgi:hypothetical protein